MAKDILTSEDGDILIKDGNLVFGDGDDQNLGALLNLKTGMLRHKPLMGPNIYRLVNGRESDVQFVLRDIKLNMVADNWKNIKVELINGKLNVTGSR